MAVHARGFAFNIVILHGVCRERDDGNMSRFPFDAANFSSGFIAIEVRHLTIHQNQIEVARLPGIDRFSSIFHGVDFVSQSAQGMSGNLFVDRIVLGQQIRALFLLGRMVWVTMGWRCGYDRLLPPGPPAPSEGSLPVL